MLPSSLSPERGCGYRTQGGLYLEVPLSPFGRPVEDFLICEPIQPTFDLPVQGQLPFWKRDTLHLLDWIGQCFYPNVADWIEETRVLGVSSKVSIQLADRTAGNETDLSVLEALTPDSRLYFAHPRAYLHNIQAYIRALTFTDEPWKCPKRVTMHPLYDEKLDHTPCCVGVYWWDLDRGDPEPVPAGINIPEADHLVRRTLPCRASYLGHRTPEDITPEYSPGIFAKFPMIQLAVVRGDHGEHESVLDRLSRLHLTLPVLEVDQ
jgi:hypothetical protein